MKFWVASVAVMVGLCGSAQAADRPCVDWCKVRLHATDKVQTWHSPERFGSGPAFGEADGLTLKIMRHGKWLPEDFGSRNGIGRVCRAYLWRPHLQTQTSHCSDPTRITIRYRGQGSFTLYYLATYS